MKGARRTKQTILDYVTGVTVETYRVDKMDYKKILENIVITAIITSCILIGATGFYFVAGR